MKKTIVRYAAFVACFVFVLLGFSPVLADPMVYSAMRQCAIIGAEGGTIIGIVLLSAYARHKIILWASHRPILPSPSQVYASMGGLAPHLQQTLAIAQAEVRADNDEEHRLYHAVVLFVVIGQQRGDFGIRTMLGCVDRPTYDYLMRYLRQYGVVEVGRGNKPTMLVEGWSSHRVMVALREGKLPLPTPEGDSPIVVKWKPSRNTRTHAHKHTEGAQNETA
jgi:hypothetical protein